MSSTKKAEDLLHLAALLQRHYVSTPRFNVFTVLHKPTDEVRLHSRFIAALLNPQTHELGVELLKCFIDQVRIPDFSLKGVRVVTEQQRIDILVTNTKRQAILIENKLFAADQENQLVTYYQSLRAQGYREVHVVFLSLDGSPPASHSLGHLEQLGTSSDMPGTYQTAAYAECLRPWLAKCVEKSVLHPSLRESIVQYHDLITQLTGQDMDTHHLDTLADTLLEGDNLLAAHDIRLAFDEALIRLQAKIWIELRETISGISAEMDQQLDSQHSTCGNVQEQCRVFMRSYKRRSPNCETVGLYYKLPNLQNAFIAAEAEINSIYLGIKCSNESTEYKPLCQLLDKEGAMASRNHLWPGYAYIPQDLNLRNPSIQSLRTLTDDAQLKSYVQAMADEMLRLWHLSSGLKIEGYGD